MKIVSPHLISAILQEPWAISPDHAHALSPLLASVFEPNLEFEAKEPIAPISMAVPMGAAGNSSASQAKTIKVISVGGALTKNTQMCGPAGTVLIGNWIKEADNDRIIDGIFVKFETPGGTVVGTEELGNIMKNTSKPILAFIDDQCCSAGYWLACNCDEIVANNTTAEVGSIGVLLSFADMQPAYEKMGVKFHTITANQSSEKISRFAKLKAGEYDDYKKEVLDPLADKFIGVVKANRGNLDAEKFFTGKVYHAQDVVGTLIDSIKTFDEALQHLAEMCDSSQSSSSNSATTNTTMKFTRLAKAAGVEGFETADGSINMTGEMASAVETALEASETATATLQQQLQERADQSTTIDQQQARIAELEAQVTELGNKAGADSASVNKETDGEGAATGDEGFFGRYARLSQKS